MDDRSYRLHTNLDKWPRWSLKAIDGPEVPSLQVRVTGAAESKWSGPDESGFASMVWHPSADILETADADGWVTVTGEQLAKGAEWRITGPTFNNAPRTFEAIKEANPAARVDHVGMQLAKKATPSDVLVGKFVYKGCVTTFATTQDAGSLASLTGLFGSLS